jgi:hypothetical protein
MELTGKARRFHVKSMGSQSMVACSSSRGVRSMGNNWLKITSGLSIRILIAAFLLSIVASQAEVFGQSSNEILVTKRAKQDNLFEPQKFEFSIGHGKYLILSNGDGVRTDFKGKSANFILPLDANFYVERVYYLDGGGDLIIIYGISDGDVGGGTVIRLENKTLKKRWPGNIPGFNIGESVVKDKWLYLTAIGFVGKLDLNTGKYTWKYDGLYKKMPGVFNSFERPLIDGELIKFTEVLSFNSKNPPVTIIINGPVYKNKANVTVSVTAVS